MRLGFFEKLKLYSFFNANKDNPEALASYYFAHSKKIEALKREYPDWPKYVDQYPDLRDRLRGLGVPV